MSLPRLLLGPGPSDAHPRVLSAMTTPLLGHLDPHYLDLMNETQELLRQMYRTRNKNTFPLPATGMGGMEACLVNLIEPGDTAVIFKKGFFGDRMVEIAGRAGAMVTVFDRPWGQVFDLDQIRDALKRLTPKVMGIVHAETSTGARQPLEEIGAICRETGTLLLVDCVTSLGCINVDVDGWGIDAVYSCSQKGLGCPPGLSPVSFSDRAMETIRKRRSKVQSWYFDMTLLSQYWGSERMYHHTAPISMTYALREGLKIVLEEGLDPRFHRHERNHRALKAGLEAIGLTYIADPNHLLPQLNAVRIPDGIDDVTCRKQLLAEFGIEIGGGLGEFKGKAWRIGMMGFNSKPNCVVQVLSGLEQVMRKAGAQIEPGAGVTAAETDYFRGSGP